MIRVAYLFGAGATHGEILNLELDPDETFIRNNGLLISDVSRRVIKAAQEIRGFKKGVELVSSAEGSLNIELLITLFETNQISNNTKKVRDLKALVELDILRRVSAARKRRFYLHKALYELHSLIEDRESLLGIISLNYDDVLDDAFKTIHPTKEINYCFTSVAGAEIPLMKLHGSFNWRNVNNYGKKRMIPIIPLGVNKNYLIPPYNFIWGRAFEILTKCDVLRIIGCSLNQSDLGLLDLLFKAHLERSIEFEIQIIDFQSQGDKIKNSYGFFKNIVKIEDIESRLIPDIIPETGNPFKAWLKAKGNKMLGTEIEHTKYLSKCFL